MSKKYIAYVETDCNNHLGYKQIRKFKNLNDAISFIESDKTTRMYPGIFLEMIGDNGKIYEWNTVVQGWEERSC